MQMPGTQDSLDYVLKADPDRLIISIVENMQLAMRGGPLRDEIKSELYTWNMYEVLKYSPTLSYRALLFLPGKYFNDMLADFGLNQNGEKFLDLIGILVQNIQDIKFNETMILEILDSFYSTFYNWGPLNTIPRMVALLETLPEAFAESLAKVFSSIITRYNLHIDESEVEIHEGITQIHARAGVEA